MRWLKLILGSLGLLLTGWVVAAEAPAAPGVAPVFARVDGVVITVPEYQAALKQTFRDRYYHFNPPEAEKEKVRREVGQNLIDRVLMLKEIERRHIQPDTAAVQKEIDRYESRYRGSPQWEKMREQALPGLRAFLEQQNRLKQLENTVKSLPPPDDAALKAYYEKNPGMFTEPEQVKLSMILLKVDPSSPVAAWNKAREDAAALIQQLKGGAEFAALAKARSQDDSAARGGDMGYLHKGMIPSAIQAEVDKLDKGVLAPEPVTVLEGVAVVRVDDRLLARKRDFADVMKRAAELWSREEAQKAWTAFLEKLRAGASVTVDEKVYTSIN